MNTPSENWKEIVPDGEAAELEAFAETLRELQRKHASNGKPHRALHAKGHLGVRATFEVLPDLPEPARQGLFAKPAKYEAVVRFSNGAGRVQSDRVGDVRGVAIKLLGVEGKKVIPGLESATTQDFLLIHSPATPVRDAREFTALVAAASGPKLLFLPRFAAKIGLFRAFHVVKKAVAGLSQPFPSFAGRRMFSALPIRFGPYAAHYALLPRGDVAPSEGDGMPLGEDLARRLAKAPLVWDFAVQFFVDESKTPIEDPSVEWKESDSPFVVAARLEIPQQDVNLPDGQRLAQQVEKLSFDPWHALVEHRPLGQMMRARNHAYRLSTQERKALGEPAGREVSSLLAD